MKVMRKKSRSKAAGPRHVRAIPARAAVIAPAPAAVPAVPSPSVHRPAAAHGVGEEHQPRKADGTRALEATPTADGVAEDLAYLRVASLLREHREDEARAAAKQYWRSFPNGFRRVEVARVADGH